jgi:conjugative transfer signal peptidase TraF
VTRRLTRRLRSRDLPPHAPGEARRRARLARRRLQRRVAVVAVLAGLVVASAAVPPAPRLVWNASASAPVGLYAVSPGALPRAGDMVIAWVPGPARRLAAQRHYIPINVPLVKRVAAVPGDDVCAIGEAIFVRGRLAALRRIADGMGRAMPWWNGCRRLGDGDYFLLMADSPDSFDGRYFGISTSRDIVGRATLLWAR